MMSVKLARADIASGRMASERGVIGATLRVQAPLLSYAESERIAEEIAVALLRLRPTKPE